MFSLVNKNAAWVMRIRGFPFICHAKTKFMNYTKCGQPLWVKDAISLELRMRNNGLEGDEEVK